MYVTAKSSLSSSKRLFTTTRSSQSILDYFKFYNKTKKTESDYPVKKVEDTSKVIENIESKKTVIQTKNKVEILGKINPRYTDKSIIRKNLNGFKVLPWIPKNNKYIKLLNESKGEDYTASIKQLLSELYSKNGITEEELNSNLVKRFSILKQLQITFGVQVPDIKLSQLSTFSKIESFLIQELNPRKLKLNEKEPHAIYLDPEEFRGSNVSVGEWVFEKQKIKNYKKLLKKAGALEGQVLEKYQKEKRV